MRIRLGTLALAVAIAAAFVPMDTAAIVIRHDRDDARYVVLGRQYPQLVHLRTEKPGGPPDGFGTLVGTDWVATAAHIAELLEPGHRVTIGDEGRAVASVHLHPDWNDGPNDLALVRLDRPVAGVAPARLYAQRDEARREVTLVGRGDTGTGLTGPIANDGEVRGATNRVDEASDFWLKLAFDRGAEATELEGISGPGDSGGPAFLDRDGARYLVGVSSAQSTRSTGGREGIYGVVEHYTRISSYVGWLRATMDSARNSRIPTSPHFTIERLGEGVWAVLARSAAATSNAAVIDLGDATLVYDALLTPEAAADLRHAAEELTGRPPSYLVLSHWHNDHIRGSHLFLPATVVSSERTRALIAEREPREIVVEKSAAPRLVELSKQRLADETRPHRVAERRFWIEYYEAMLRSHTSLRLTLPEVTFVGRMAIHGSERSIELLDFAGHTGSDTVLWMPAERFAFLSDLLFVEHQPYLPDGDPDAHRATLRAVRDLRPLRILPGHGPVSGPESLDAFIAYIDDVERAGMELWNARGTDEDAMNTEPPPPYDRWGFTTFYRSNLRFMLRRARAAAGE